MALIIKLHLALHRFTVKFILRNFHHFQYTFFRPLDCDANPCKNGGTCVEVPSRKTYKCNCTDAFTGKNCSESTAVAQSTDASREHSKLLIFSLKISHELNLLFLMMPLQWPNAAYSLPKEKKKPLRCQK